MILILYLLAIVFCTHIHKNCSFVKFYKDTVKKYCSVWCNCDKRGQQLILLLTIKI